MILRVPRFDPDPTDDARIDRAFGLTEPQAVACCNWPQEYPYAPRVTFRMFHTGARLYVRFEVEEECTMAPSRRPGPRVDRLVLRALPRAGRRRIL